MSDEIIRISHPSATGFIGWYMDQDCTCSRNPEKCAVLEEYKRYRFEIYGEE